MAPPDLSGYVTVPQRITQFRDKHPQGCLRPVDPANPYKLVELGSRVFIVYAAAAYRDAGDPLPGIGVAWEPFPGKTPYTRDSELMNAETSAWGRAIVAALAADTQSGIATQEDVRNRHDDGGEVRESARREVQAVSAERVQELFELAKAAPDRDALLAIWKTGGTEGALQSEGSDPETGERMTFEKYLEKTGGKFATAKSAGPAKKDARGGGDK